MIFSKADLYLLRKAYGMYRLTTFSRKCVNCVRMHNVEERERERERVLLSIVVV